LIQDYSIIKNLKLISLMKKMMFFLTKLSEKATITITALIICIGVFSCKPGIEDLDKEKIKSKKDSGARVADYTLKLVSSFKVGCAEEFGSTYGSDPALQNLITKEFDRLTSNEFKMDFVGYQENGFINYTNLDNELNFAKNKGLDLFGHSLLYYNSSPAWLKNIDTKAKLEFNTKRYIEAMVKRAEQSNFNGVLKGIDVVNELFNYDGKWNGASINGSPVDNVQKWRNLYGTEDEFKNFIGRCFKWARDADNLNGATNIKLFLNDYDQESFPNKRDAIYNLCAWLKSNGYPIDGIGLQFHFLINDNPAQGFDRPTTTAGVATAIDLASQLSGGFFDIHISELDLRMDKSSVAAPLYNYAEQWKQYDLARFVVNKYRTTVNPSKQFGVTLWNLTDKYTWYNQPFLDNDKDLPTLFDVNSNRKIAYYGFLSGASAQNQFFIPETYFHFYNVGSGKYAEVENGSLNDAALLKQQAIKSSNNRQVFQFLYNNAGNYNIKNINSNKIWDHYLGSPYNIQQYGSDAQGAGLNRLFVLEGIGGGVFRLKAKTVYPNNIFKTVQVPSINNAAQLQLANANDQNGLQYWKLEE
jgi:endo-1,4-beta-xylanase